MRTYTRWATLLLPLAAAALALPWSIGGCQAEGSGGGDGGNTTTGTQTGTSTGVGGSGTGTNTGTNSGTSTGDPTCGYNAQDITIDQFTNSSHANHVGEGVAVRLTGVVAMSRKFKVSGPGDSGSCLWGVFLSSPGLQTTEAYSGIMAVSYGYPAEVEDGGTQAYCPVIEMGEPAGDAFPDDVGPGDVLTVVGNTDSYVPGVSECTGVTAQLQISQVCEATRTATGGAVPTPAVISGSDLNLLNAPGDAAFHAKWGGVKVRIQSVTADGLKQGDCDSGEETIISDAQFLQGSIQLNEGNGLRIKDKIYYQGLLSYLGKTCYQSPVFCTTTGNAFSFSRIDGFSYLNYCEWGLEPELKCTDFDPASQDCPCTNP